MLDFQYLVARAWKWIATCILCIPLTLSGETKVLNSLDHSPEAQAAMAFGAKAADFPAEGLATLVQPTPTTTAATSTPAAAATAATAATPTEDAPPVVDITGPQLIRNVLQAMNTEGLDRFTSDLTAAQDLSADAFNKLVDQIPSVSETTDGDPSIRKDLKAEFARQVAASSGPTAKDLFLKYAQEELNNRTYQPCLTLGKCGGDNPPNDDGKIPQEIANKIDDLNKNISKGDDKAPDTHKADTGKTPDDLTGQLLAALLAKQGDNNKDQTDPGAAPPSDGGGQGSGSGGGSGDGSGSGDSSGQGSNDSDSGKDRSTAAAPAPATSSSSDTAKSDDSSKDDNSKDDSFGRSRSSSSDDTPTTASTDSSSLGDPKSAGSDPFLPDNTSSNYGPSKFAGKGGALSPISSNGAAGSSGGGGGGGYGGMGGMGMGMLGGMGGMGGMGGGGTPFSYASPANPGMPVDQKFEYSRLNPYGSSNGGEGSTSSEESYESDSSPVLAAAGGTILVGGSSSSPNRALAGNAEPAFRHAVGSTLSNLCLNGLLSCNRKAKE